MDLTARSGPAREASVEHSALKDRERAVA